MSAFVPLGLLPGQLATLLRPLQPGLEVMEVFSTAPLVSSSSGR